MIDRKVLRAARRLPEEDRIGWCISGVAWRIADDGNITVWNRPFTVGKEYTRAEEYALRELHKIWDIDSGWHLIVVAMPINLEVE